MDALFWADLLLVLPAEIIPACCLLAMVESRHSYEAGAEPGFYP